MVEFIANDHHQQKGEIVLVVGGATTEKDMAQEKLDQLLTRLLQDLSVKAASQLAADLTGIKKKIAYETPLAVYFDTSRFKKYYQFSRQKQKNIKKAAREEVVVDPNKRNPANFALWFKLKGRYKNHILRWPSPWGLGFPGWHIECSVMSTKYLGQPFDIHTGGVDLIFPHHTNEIAQSEAAKSRSLANYWLHGEFLQIDRTRMGKSERNFVTLQDLIEKGFKPLSYRYLVLTTHYSSRLNFTKKSLQAAQNSLDHLLEIIKRLHVSNQKVKSHTILKNELVFKNIINNNLDTPRVLAWLWKILKTKLLNDKEKFTLILKADQILGLGLKTISIKKEKIPPVIQQLVQKREKLREGKKWSEADVIRNKIKNLNWLVEDTSTGPRLKRIATQNQK